MATSLIELINNDVKPEVKLGQDLFCEITDCVLLTVNERAKLTGKKDPLSKILSHARDGSITQQDIATLNSRVVNNLEQAMKLAHPEAVFITSTHAKVAAINDEFKQLMIAKGGIVHRLVAKHVPKTIGILAPDDLSLQDRRKLYSISGACVILLLLHLLVLLLLSLLSSFKF